VAAKVDLVSAPKGESVKGPKDVVVGYFKDVSAGAYAAARARFAEDATLWILGEGRWPLGGTHDNAGVKRIQEIVAARFPKSLNITVKGVTAEGERVAVEAESYGVRRDGKCYQNQYHFLFVIRDGKIRQRREYLDVLHAADLLCGEMGPPIVQTGTD
jgi:ketosteroid isomerase-like protein